MPEPEPAPDDDLSARVRALPLWYHTVDLAPGVLTPGWFDLRPVVDRLPWPDVEGLRCLDVGTFDGFLAFELERRGAREVVCTDLPPGEPWDWPPHMREAGPRRFAAIAGETGRGYRLAHEALGSSVQRVETSVYDLSPDRVGTFDVVVCGTLLLHLRDPLRALEAIASVCAGSFLSAEQIRLGLTVRHPRRALAELDGAGDLGQWWIPNAAGHRQMLRAAGFEVLRFTRPYAVPFGSGHPPARGLSGRLALLRRRLLLGAAGVPHSAALCRPLR